MLCGQGEGSKSTYQCLAFQAPDDNPIVEGRGLEESGAKGGVLAECGRVWWWWAPVVVLLLRRRRLQGFLPLLCYRPMGRRGRGAGGRRGRR